MSAKKKPTRGPTPNYNWGDRRVPTIIEGPSMTKGSHAADCDVNQIVAKYDRMGVLNHITRAEGVYADVSDIGSYSEAIATVRDAEKAFLDLPSGLRSHFDHDPAQYLDWSAQASPEAREDLLRQISGASRHLDARPSDSSVDEPPEPADSA